MDDGRSIRLRVIRPETETGAKAGKAGPVQDCGVCKTQPQCWSKGIREEHAILNLLTCRIKRGIEVNRSAKLFLEMVRPKLKTYAKMAVRGSNIDIETALADLESETIGYIQHHYMMGEIAYPLHRLFSPQNGHITFYARNYAKKTRKWEDMNTLQDGDELREDQADTSTVEETETDETHQARLVVEDGISLSLSEYRVLKFCMTNTIEAKRPLNGLHVYLSRNMGVVRARVTRIFKVATEKVVDEVRSSL